MKTRSLIPLEFSQVSGIMKVMTDLQSTEEQELNTLDEDAQSIEDYKLIKLIRATIRKYRTTALIVAGLTLSTAMNAQSQNSVDFTIKSNIIDPDTLKGDEKLIFYHFEDKTSEELKAMEANEIKTEFAKLGLDPKEKQRFIDAYFFFVNDIEAHKIDCEYWEEFKDLAPKKEE